MSTRKRSLGAFRDQRPTWVRGWRLWAWVVPVVLIVVPLWMTPYLGRGLATLLPSVTAQILAALTLAAAFLVLAVPPGRREPGTPYPTARTAAASSVLISMLLLAPLAGRAATSAGRLRAVDDVPALIWAVYATYPILVAGYWFATRGYDDRRVAWANERARDHRLDAATDPTRFHMQPRLVGWAAVPLVLMYGAALVGVLS